MCYEADFRNGHAFIALQADPHAMQKGWVLHAGSVFLNYLFQTYPFRKIYAESPGFVVDSFRSTIGDGFVEEARLKDHEMYRGQYWDKHIFALYRSEWEKAQAHARTRPRTDAEPGREPFSFEQFVSYIAEQFELEEGELTAETRFVDDLDFDSVRVLELLCSIEELGVTLEADGLNDINTLDDAFFTYIQHT